MSGKFDLTLAATFALSLLVWIAVSAAAGGGEAWDKSAYWSVGLPVIYLGAAALAWLGPATTWKLWLGSLLGQFVGLLLTASSWSLWPLGLIMLAVLSVPVPVAALVVRSLRRRFSS